MLSAPVQAQTRIISNLTETKAKTGPSFHVCTTGPDTSYHDGCAIAFTTDVNTFNRYTLNSVTLSVHALVRATFNVSIHATSSGSPGTQIGSNLTKVGTATSGEITFNASGITLNGGTTYFVQITATSLGNNAQIQFHVTTSDAQTGSTGWSIANVSRYLPDNSSTWSDLSSSRTMLLSVNATTTTSVLDPPTGFAGDSRTAYGYGSGNNPTEDISPSGQSRTFKASFLLRGVYTGLTSTNYLTCASDTTLEYGWYRSSAPTTRFGIGEVVTPPGSNTRGHHEK